MATTITTRTVAGFLFAALALGAGLTDAAAQAVTIQITVKNQRFQPAEVRAPANKPIRLVIKNLDATPMDFESVSLRVEKVVVGHGQGTINVRALQPGRYKFFDDFHQESRGVLVVQ